MKLSRRELLKAGLGGFVFLGSSGIWVPQKARAGTTFHVSDWSYALGKGKDAILDGYNPDSTLNYPKRKWHDCILSTDWDSVEVVNNPPAECPTPNALKLNWFFDEQMGPGSWVAGTDRKIYRCISDHVSTTNDCPITGSNWTTYWTLDEYGRTKGAPTAQPGYARGRGPIWVSGRQYWKKGGQTSIDLKLYTANMSANYEVPWPLPNPFYFQMWFYSESLIDYAEAGRKYIYWKGAGGRAASPMVQIYNTYQWANGAANNPDLPLASGYNEGAFIVIHNHPSNPNDNTINTSTGMKITGHHSWFGGANQPSSHWPDCPETGPQESEGIMQPNRWHCTEFGIYSDHQNGWIRAWLDGKMCINACKEAWPGRTSYDTLATYGGQDAPPDYITGIPSVRNGGVVRDHVEYTAAWKISDSYIGMDGGRPGAPNPPSNVRVSGVR